MLSLLLNGAYSISSWIHITAAALATFIFIPLNLFTPKGSLLHKRIGRCAAFLLFLLVIASLFMLINPVFPNRFALISNKHHWNAFFKATFYEPAFFLWMDVLAIYMTISAIRIWKRIKAIHHQQKSYHQADIFLMIITAVFSLFFLILGVLELVKNSPFKSLHYSPFGLTFINTAIYTLIILIFDLVTFFKKEILTKWGWALHAYKMLFVWHGLLSAFLVRMKISLDTFNTFNTFEPVLEVFFSITTIIILWFYVKKIIK